VKCYKCADAIPDGEPFYNDHDQYVCKPCFSDAKRCFTCRFPGRDLRPVEGLGPECEFCRDRLISPDSELGPVVEPLGAFLKGNGMGTIPEPRFDWLPLRALREMQTEADLPEPAFIDDFLRYAYPVYHRAGVFYLLPRLTKPTFVAYTVVQLAAADLAGRFGLPDLAGRTPFHAFARGWCHWLGYEAARLLKYDLEWRQLRKWPELGLRGDFERWERMAQVNRPAKLLAHLQASLGPLARKHLVGSTDSLP
jgi:hypothetical protein